jgi:predicted nucleotidyltransferase component of viral defense system
VSPHETTNVAASVHQRLKNQSDRTGRYFNEVLLNYGMERFLYRLSLSPSGKRFVLKGGLMLMVWRSAMYRPTRDIDLLGHLPNDPVVVAAAIREACQQPVVDDGLIFDAESVQTAPIAVEKEYEGVRVTFSGRLARAIIHMQVDVGFGDVIVPQAQEIEVPSILGFPPACLLAYPRETMVAEKLEAMIRHDETNSRVRDFLDVWLLSRQFEFSGDELLRAVRATFTARGTVVGEEPACFTTSFGEDKTRRVMWERFLERSQIEGAPAEFADVVQAVARFAEPLLEAVANDLPFEVGWIPPGPWSALR